MIDLFNTNRSLYRIVCFYNIDTIQDENVEHTAKQSGKFYARLLTPIQSTSDVLGSSFYVNNKYLTIETCDNISEIVDNFNGGINYKITIPSFNKSYLINNTQVVYDNDNLELQKENNAKRTTILALSEIRNDEKH